MTLLREPDYGTPKRPGPASVELTVDGVPGVRSCVTPAASMAGRDVVTIEGVCGDVARAVQEAWRRLDVAQALTTPEA